MAFNAYGLLLQLFASHLLFLPVLTRDVCYWPNGSLTEDDYEACHSGDSVCCYEGDVCLSNNLCYGAKYGVPYRGACTAKDWFTEACPTQYCNGALSNGAANLIPCDAPEENWWCGKNEICQTGDGSSFGPWPSGISKNIASVHDSKISTTASPSQLSSVTSPNSTTRSNISSGTTPASTLASITSTTVDEKIHEKSPSPISIGLGVGLSLGIALLGLLGLHVSKIRRWRALKATMQQRSVESRPPELEANDTGSDRRHHEIDGHIGVPEMAAQREVQRYEL